MDTVVAQPAVYSNSIGNKHLLSQMLERSRKKMKVLSLPPPSHTDISIINLYTSFICGCALCGSSRQDSNCLMVQLCQNGSSDFSRLCATVKSCHEDVRMFNKIEKRVWMLGKFKESVRPDGVSSGRQKMSYQVKVTDGSSIQVCKKVFAKIYDSSTHQLEKCAEAIKEKTEEAYLRGHKKYSDSHIPTYTYAEVKKICEKNLNNFNAAEGK